MNENIFCHICDEELADTIENLPDKCPICDTRKYEIIQEIKMLEEDDGVDSWPEPSVELEKITEEITPLTVEIVESTAKNNSTVIVEEQDPISDIIYNDDENADKVVFKENNTEEVHVVVDDVPKEIIFNDPPSDIEQDVVFESSNDDVIFNNDSSEVIFEKVANSAAGSQVGPQKTGASALEVIPDKETGFAAGSYLILYNAEKKAIAYFKIDNVGSIIIGRSSDRGSPNDIDLTMAWKQAYKDTNSETLQSKMRMVKGISRKHALVRYDEAKNGYVFFHLSDKNYTTISTVTGEKRERAPKNRNPILLEPGSLISMGNHKNYIIMRFKEIF